MYVLIFVIITQSFRFLNRRSSSCPRLPSSSRLSFFLSFASFPRPNHCLSFLDLSLKRMDDKLIIDWFHKEIFSERYLSYYSGQPLCHKIGTIYSLMNRAVLFSQLTFKKNLEFVINLLLDNGFLLNTIF